MPFSNDEMQRILQAIDPYVERTPRSGKANARRLRALILILRFSGLRISDVVGLSLDRVSDNRLFLYTQKTEVPVRTVLPDFVVRALEATPQASEKYFFWSGRGQIESAVRSWQTRLRRFFKFAKIPNGHAHRFRDTFAVALLLAGVPIDRVSILLGHQSVRITEKHYNPWVRARQEQLEADVERAWSRDPIVFTESEGTQKLRGETPRPN
jgi:integrase